MTACHATHPTWIQTSPVFFSFFSFTESNTYSWVFFLRYRRWSFILTGSFPAVVDLMCNFFMPIRDPHFFITKKNLKGSLGFKKLLDWKATFKAIFWSSYRAECYMNKAYKFNGLVSVNTQETALFLHGRPRGFSYRKNDLSEFPGWSNNFLPETPDFNIRNLTQV